MDNPFSNLWLDHLLADQEREFNSLYENKKTKTKKSKKKKT